ncbi:von Willebrand factor A domain-containing protein 5B1 [Folsomia candida]|uniref:von Willebrand factor A domain-containing protein 5B1 n=1 Tax=Folsomia candida TaxID=158441 RepID=A0A226CZI8_FOLCA|nr:von Willebrand factor A domain-containing protein 5B1 [Folsomia candida]
MDSKTAMIKSDFIKPNLRCDDQKYEFIIILDRSSSMDGDKIVLAKQALHFALQSLPVSCFFNVVAFNGTHSMIFEASQPYTQENICIAKKFLDGEFLCNCAIIRIPFFFICGKINRDSY